MNPTATHLRLLWILVIAGFVLDQGSKYLVFRWLGDGQQLQGEREIIPGAFRLLAQFTPRPVETEGWRAPLQALGGAMLPKVNQGALFGLGNEYAWVANAAFAAVSVLAAIAIVFWSTRAATAADRSLCAALGLILAGTLGNLYDRLVFHGVRDFLYFYWIEWPVFNVADCCLVCGAFLLLGQAFWGPRPAADTPATCAASSGMHEMARAQ
jgi:lipoprotein signal peptidase